MTLKRAALVIISIASLSLLACATQNKSRGYRLASASPTDDIQSFVVTLYTSGDNKDEGNGVKVSIVRNGEVVASRGFVDESLTYPPGDVRDWPIKRLQPFIVSDASKSKLLVTMSGNSGNWEAKFSVLGIKDDGTAIVFLPQSAQVHFESGETNTREFQMKMP